MGYFCNFHQIIIVQKAKIRPNLVTLSATQSLSGFTRQTFRRRRQRISNLKLFFSSIRENVFIVAPPCFHFKKKNCKLSAGEKH
jgi:hypothetical protein